jgi:hypothetical protein
MYTIKHLKRFVGITLAVLFLAGCGGPSTEPISTATSPPAPAPPEATKVEFPQIEILPLTGPMCDELANTLAQTVGISVEQSEAPFEDHLRGVAGRGCMASATGTGHDFPDQTWPDMVNALEGMLTPAGWQVDERYRADGPSGFIAGYRQVDRLCLLDVNREPVDMSLCPEDEPIFVCWAELAPEQKIHTITLNCAHDDFAALEPQPESELEPVRIEFAPGAISEQVHGSLPPGGGARFVLAAAAGQEMYVYLTFSFEPDPTEPPAILISWGEDGTVLLTDHVDAMSFQGELPFTQDYFINVRSRSQESLDFTLEVIIPPLTGGPVTRPGYVPVTFQPVYEILEDTGVPPMLPSEFRVDESLPPIHPFIYTAIPGEYELSLDFGEDCMGAGACHYGSLTGKLVDSRDPVSTTNIPYDVERAQVITLAEGIEGYFIEAACGASCDDTKVFWILNGYQYMVGIKAGKQADVLALANAAIENSLQ